MKTKATRKPPGPACSICSHRQRGEIDQALVEGVSAPRIAARYREIGDDAIRRHAAAHLPATLALAAVAAEQSNGLDTLRQLDRCLERVNLLFDACHDWLLDPEHPTRYTLEPRAGDIRVIYEEQGDDGKMHRKRARLSELLIRAEGAAAGIRVVETKHADPRELVLQASKRLEGLSELLARIRGELPDPGVAVLISPAWIDLRARIIQALEPYPEARQAAAVALLNAS